MTIQEIQALRAELEVALRQAFSDFERLSGQLIQGVDVNHVTYAFLECPTDTTFINSVTVKLESI